MCFLNRILNMRTFTETLGYDTVEKEKLSFIRVLYAYNARSILSEPDQRCMSIFRVLLWVGLQKRVDHQKRKAHKSARLMAYATSAIYG